ncbi:multidrug resistance efflux transporter family protein [Tahibacter soli]|uniref:Multidrug resistance efflux transporter family protein n=1 Tax=Tahibacter soli TaxID=2983605 RepID=A0A9X3YMN0_9GAMM|nr:multidrug resistance efflux transporter family protein [Tahibacter soli]MDC8014045.1 multidrug resistance efflux transporter family protein [Tahibacter soli]
MRRHAPLAVAIALASALFFTATYVLNRATAVGGGHWAWTAALRYFLTLPMLALVLRWQGGFAPVWRALRAHPVAWLVWSGIGFTAFCVCLTWAAASGPSWLIAGTFQLTVIAGMLMAPLIYRDARARLPKRSLGLGVVIVGGVVLMQWGHAKGGFDATAWWAFASVTVSAFLYPLGNRKILLHLERTGESLNATQRVFGMTLASQPFWILVALYGFADAGWPSGGQALLAAGVALSAGTIATVLFFHATGMVRNDATALGAVEAMQAAEILFSTVLGVWFLAEAWPHGWAAVGAAVVMLGIVGLSLVVAADSAGNERRTQALESDRGA